MIGNESWNNNNVNSSAEIYARDVIDFSKAMKKVDPTVLIIANGSGDEFFKTIITSAGDHFDRLTVSNYGVYDFVRGYQSYADTARVLIWPAISAIQSMHAYTTPDQRKKLKVIVAEFGTIDWAGLWEGTNDMGHAIVAFDMTGQLLLQKDIEFSCFWNTRWIENGSKPGRDHDALDENGNLYPTGQALRIWGNFLGKQMVKSDTTGHLAAFSSYDPHSSTLFSYLINKGPDDKMVRIEVPGKKIEAVEEIWELYGKGPEDINPLWQRRQEIRQKLQLTLKGTSITVIRIKLED
jgi:hypothetical protein